MKIVRLIMAAVLTVWTLQGCGRHGGQGNIRRLQEIDPDVKTIVSEQRLAERPRRGVTGLLAPASYFTSVRISCSFLLISETL